MKKLNEVLKRSSGYGLASACVVAAAVLRYLLGPVLGATIPVVMFTVPVVIAALYGGFGPAVFATLTSALISSFFFVAPYYSFAIDTSAGIVAILVFIAVGLAIGFLGMRLAGSESEVHLKSARLQETTDRLQFILNAAQIGDWDLDLVNDTAYRSLRHDMCFGYTEPIPQWGFEIALKHMHPNDQARVRQAFEEAVRDFKNWHVECRVIWPDGSLHWIAAHGSVYGVGSKATRMAGIVYDITERKHAEEKLRHASLHDPLTGLPNRAMLFEYAGHLLPHNRRTNVCAAVLFLDLDRFKPINDSHGHEIGDAVLKEVATRLSRSLLTEDIVVRLGGDEFLVLLQDIKHASYAAEVARHIVDKINEPYHLGELVLTLSTSVGISIFPKDGQDIDTLISHADAAMYQAKQAGRNNFQFYSAEFAAGTKLQLVIEQQLRSALRTDAFHLFYQPVLDLQSGDVVSVEALLRWKNPDIGPQQFVPVAEATGIINPIGRWVLQEASRQHKAWLAEGLPAIPIAVNVSVVEFRDRDFVSRFERLLSEYGIKPTALQVELTETAVMDDIEHAAKVLSQLQALGVTILLDDFGTGHSSLAYLARLPLNKMKIDQSFIKRLENDVASRAITDAMLALGNTLNLKVVAEGIESQSVLDYLHSRGCHQAQGYYFSPPMSGNAFQAWWRQHRQKASDADRVKLAWLPNEKKSHATTGPFAG